MKKRKNNACLACQGTGKYIVATDFDDIQKQMVAMRKRGATYKEIQAATGRGLSTIHYYLNERKK